MTTLQSVFDRIYCINLDRRRDRWEECQNLFADLGLDVQRIAGVDGNPGVPSPLPPGHVGCNFGHFRAYLDALACGYERVLILEDDFHFCPDFADNFANWFGEVPDDWGLLYFGYLMSKRFKRATRQVAPHVIRIKKAWQIHALGVTKSTLCRMLPQLATFQLQADECFLRLSSRLRNAVPAYGFTPKLITQRKGYSDISHSVRKQR